MKLVKRFPDCTDCRLHETAQYVCLMGRGSIPGRTMLVGEAPGFREDDVGKPFQGKAGGLLDDILADTGFSREDVYITNVVKCRPPDNRTPKAGEIKACWKHLEREIEKVNPQYIMLMGAAALKPFIRGKITDLRGTVHEWNGRTLVLTLHPAHALRYPDKVKDIKKDFTLLRELIDGVSQEKEIPVNPQLVVDFKSVQRMVNWIKKASDMAIDTETSGLKVAVPGSHMTCFGIGDDEVQWIVPLSLPGSPFPTRRVQQAVVWSIYHASKGKRIAAQNGKFDNIWTNYLYGIRFDWTFDTERAAHLINENDRTGLKYLSYHLLGLPDYDVDVETKQGKKSVRKLLLEYLPGDVYATFKLKKYFVPRLKRQELVPTAKHLVFPMGEPYERIETNGVYIRRNRFNRVKRTLQQRRAAVVRKLNNVAEINWGSPTQVATVLFDQLDLPQIEETAAGNPGTGESVLKQLLGKHPVIQLLLTFRGLHQLETHFINGWEKRLIGDYLYPSFKLTGTVTGRPSCIDPNLQQTPRDPLIRSLVGAEDGWVILKADYSQIELKVAAMLSGCPGMLHVFQTGGDIHTATAAWVLGIPLEKVTKDQRKMAKAVNFGYIYGMGWRKFIVYARDKYGVIFTEVQSKRARKRFFDQYYGLPKWHDRQRNLVHTLGQVRTLTGRIRHLPTIYSPEKGIMAEAERQAINSPVQGLASEFLSMSAIEIHKRLPDQSWFRPFGTIHDEHLSRVREDRVMEAAKVVQEVMEDPPIIHELGIHLTIPLEVELSVGPSWGETKVLKI